MNPRLRLALFGSGRIGQVHARSIAADPGLELVVVADPFVEAAQALATQHGAAAVSDPEEAFATEGLDGVVIASSTATHVDLLTRAVERGLPVMCEKPIDLDLDIVMACRERLAGTDVPIMLGFNRRFDANFASVQARVAAGEVGPLEQLIIISRDPAPAPASYLATSGGIFRDMTIHDFDMARFFVPDIVEVSAVGANSFSDEIRALDDYDSVTVTLRGRGGQIVTIVNSRHCAFGYDQRIEAFGSEGMLTASNVLATTVRKSGATGTEEADPYPNFFLERYAGAYAVELGAFAESIRTGRPCSPGFEDGVQALVLADAAAESARTGRSVTLQS